MSFDLVEEWLHDPSAPLLKQTESCRVTMTSDHLSGSCYLHNDFASSERSTGPVRRG